MIYNSAENEIENKIKNLITDIASSPFNIAALKDFINNSDGEYIVYLINKNSNEFYSFGDKWGRLKSYLFYNNDLSIISREHSFILSNVPKIEIDKQAVSEFIVLEYTLYNKTLIRGINKTTPAFLFSSNLKNNLLDNKLINLSSVIFKTEKTFLKQNNIALKYKNAFLKSLEARISKLNELNYNFSSDLSGGLDSRSVYFGLSKYNIDVEYFTDELISGDESKYAINVGKIYNKNVSIVKTKRDINIADMQKLTYQTGCNVNCITTLSCFQDAKERKNMITPPIAKFGGLGGS